MDKSGNAVKDTRALSGGEKSFSTICLLLSLWESIGCPIRCLGGFNSVQRLLCIFSRSHR